MNDNLKYLNFYTKTLHLSILESQNKTGFFTDHQTQSLSRNKKHAFSYKDMSDINATAKAQTWAIIWLLIGCCCGVGRRAGGPWGCCDGQGSRLRPDWDTVGGGHTSGPTRGKPANEQDRVK